MDHRGGKYTKKTVHGLGESSWKEEELEDSVQEEVFGGSTDEISSETMRSEPIPEDD